MIQRFIMSHVMVGFLLWFLFPLSSNDFNIQAMPFLTAPADSHLDSIRTEEQYFQALYAADEKAFREAFELEFLLLLDDRQKAAYDSLTTLEARKAFIKQYWKAPNPNPILPENDWLKDYLQRRAYAREHFSASKPPYFDDRGTYFIKYGKPKHRHQDGGGIKRFYFLGKPYEFSIRANESWSYTAVAGNFVVHFVREGSSYREIASLTKLVEQTADMGLLSTSKRIDLAFIWQELVKERAWLSPVMEQTRFNIQWLEEAIRHAKSTGKPGLLAGDIISPHERIFEFKRENEDIISKAIREGSTCSP